MSYKSTHTGAQIDAGVSAALNPDATPTLSSTNLVTSGGVAAKLSEKQDTLVFDNAPTDGSSNPVTSAGVYNALTSLKTDVEANESSIEYLKLREEEDRQMILGSVAEVVEDSYSELRSAPIHTAITIGQNVYPRLDNTRLGLETIKGRTVVDNDALVPCVVSGVEVTGFNQWNEEWEVGRFDQQGQPETYGYTIRSKNYNPCIPNTVYYCKIGSYGGNNIGVYWYDADKNFIKSESANSSTNLVTSPANAAYFKFHTSTTYGNTYHNDICINLSNPSRNGEYRPYQHESLSIPSTTLNGVGTAQDVLECVEVAENDYSLIKTSKMDSVDLSAIELGYNSGLGLWTGSLPNAVSGNNSVPANAISDGFVCVKASGYTTASVVGTMAINELKTLFINNGSSTNAPTGNLVYELATPIETTIAEHLTLAEVSAIAQNGGIIGIVNSNGDIVQPDLTVDTVISKSAS